MSVLDDRLVEQGIVIPHRSPSPRGIYAAAVISGGYVYTSGQLPLVEGALLTTGKVGAEVSAQDAQECAKISALNALSAIAEVLGSLDRVTRVVKLVGFVASAPAFTAQPTVIDGASQLIATVFGDAGVHARSAVGVAVLPLDSPVEVELIVEFV